RLRIQARFACDGGRLSLQAHAFRDQIADQRLVALARERQRADSRQPQRTGRRRGFRNPDFVAANLSAGHGLASSVAESAPQLAPAATPTYPSPIELSL